MIARIKGIVLKKETQEVVLDVNGIGYEVLVPMTTVFHLPQIGQEAVLHTHFVVREDAQQLFGFYDEKQRDLFRTLIKINGVGPRMALTILSGIEVNDFVACVHNNDVNTLVRLPGVGKKTAERLIIEVRDKVREWDQAAGSAEPGTVGGVPVSGSRSMQEAETALVSLGFKPQEASRAVMRASEQLESEGVELESEALIRSALKKMG